MKNKIYFMPRFRPSGIKYYIKPKRIKFQYQVEPKNDDGFHIVVGILGGFMGAYIAKCFISR